MTDSTGRTIDYLRISVTDRCNARCVYCMPEEGVTPIPHEQILRYEEITFFARICAQKGIRHIRLTGGEPLVRKDLPKLVAMLKQIDGIEQISITTNGLLLEQQLPELVSAGLDGLNISLDTLDEARFSRITRLNQPDGAARVLSAIDAACAIPTLYVKVNCVPSGINDEDLTGIAALARTRNISVRFIELMPLGCGKSPLCSFRSRDFVYRKLTDTFGTLVPAHGPHTERYEYFTPQGFAGTIGFISPVTHSFCSGCNRLRLTADGYIKACLQYKSGTSIQPLLAQGLTDHTAQLISQAVDYEIAHKNRRNHFYQPAVRSIHDTDRYMSQIGG